ncbi:nucleolin 1-like [Zingiber officinale]|uniref:nucleolin 1-like n=1 Tax=Zingiber officinale TaxID=94328 RepID=UPI001C4D7DE4|nr:nucleolin 1-like [Zingiber officinale]
MRRDYSNLHSQHYETGAPEGIAYMGFKDQESFNKAYELNGFDLGGYTLTVDEVKLRADNCDGGWSGGRDGGGRSGGRFGGTEGAKCGEGVTVAADLTLQQGPWLRWYTIQAAKFCDT